MKQKITIFILIAIFFLFSPAVLFAAEHEAADTRPPIPQTFDVGENLKLGERERAPGIGEAPGTVLADSPVLKFLAKTIDFLIAVVGSFALLVFIIGGVYLLISEGQEDRIQKGKQAMTFSLIGLVIALMAYVITTVVQSIFF